MTLKDPVPIHGSDHCPGGPDPIPCLSSTIPCFRAYKWDVATQTVANGNDAHLTFDRWQTSDATKINNTGWTAGSPDYITEVNFLVRGLWAITVMVDLDFAGAQTGSCGLALEDTGGTLQSAPGITFPIFEPAGDASSGQYSFTQVLSFPPVWAEQTSDTLAPDLPDMTVNFSNNGGSSVNVDYAMWEIHLLYEFDYETLNSVMQHQA